MSGGWAEVPALEAQWVEVWSIRSKMFSKLTRAGAPRVWRSSHSVVGLSRMISSDSSSTVDLLQRPPNR